MKETIPTLDNAWSAEVRLNGGQTLSIWWTAWSSTKHLIQEVISISSDLPRQPIIPTE